MIDDINGLFIYINIQLTYFKFTKKKKINRNNLFPIPPHDHLSNNKLEHFFFFLLYVNFVSYFILILFYFFSMKFSITNLKLNKPNY